MSIKTDSSTDPTKKGILLLKIQGALEVGQLDFTTFLDVATIL